uniref:TF-B3 domain-containing protein n=1 Tax=Kalanchoe fedtschenkoi TaxID=63787 RepID=A0A7N1A0I3_KALFE
MVDTKAPEKPHLLQPVLPGHTKDFLIPTAFFKYLNGRKCEQALLRSSRGGEPWPVKINGRRILEGWEEFAAHHHLHVGDFVVFRYEGDLVFDVTVFGPNSCEKEY